MAWTLPSVNTTRQQGGSSSLPHPVATENPIPNPIPASGVPMNTMNAGNPLHFDPNDNTSPYYLHANENPALELVSSVLDGSNYHEWARAMKVALSSKNKFVFVNGAIKMPSTDDRKFFFWERCNNMVVAWINRVLSPTIARTVLWIDTAEGVWLDLKKRFSKQDVFRIAEIQSKIYQTKQGNSSVNEYFSKLKLLWDELLILRPAPACICTLKCKCSDDFLNKAATNANEVVEKGQNQPVLPSEHATSISCEPIAIQSSQEQSSVPDPTPESFSSQFGHSSVSQ
nr:uncharacterized protein LOC109151977 [Ipomoea trifida]